MADSERTASEKPRSIRLWSPIQTASMASPFLIASVVVSGKKVGVRRALKSALRASPLKVLRQDCTLMSCTGTPASAAREIGTE